MPTKMVFNRTLDVRPDRLDLRDLPYRPPLISLPPKFPDDDVVEEFLPLYTKLKLILDQGKEGACTGYGLAAVVNYLRFVRSWELSGEPKKLPSVSPKLLYELARLYDEWPGEDYEGSSCRGALKGWHKHGVCEDTLWPYPGGKKVEFQDWRKVWQNSARETTLGVYYRINHRSVVDMQAAIHEIGAIYVSATVHEGWDHLKAGKVSHAELSTIKHVARPKDSGGHAFALVGYNERGFVVQNSWGPKWGCGGFALLPYSDWVQFGDDAWAVALGVPAQVDSPVSVTRSAGMGLAMAGSAAVFAGRSASAAAKGDWDTDTALDHTIVTGNDGFVIRRKVDLGNAADTVEHLARTLPQDSGCKKLVIYAHGGLNSEADSLKRIAAMGPYFLENGIYPLFLTWKSGPIETLTNMLKDAVKPLGTPAGGGLMDRIADAWDRTVEVAAANAGVKSMWREMKENAELGAEADRGLGLLAKALAKLNGMEVHAIGHSAGSIVLAHLFPLLKKGQGLKTCTLWAPAATVELANARYRPALASGTVKNLVIENMSDRRERDDTVGGVYRKSLLYLVSRALEDTHKTPLMGLQATYDDKLASDVYGGFKGELTTWRGAWNQKSVQIVPRDEETISNGSQKAKIAHGSFDNDVKSANAVIERILGAPPKVRVTRLEY